MVTRTTSVLLAAIAVAAAVTAALVWSSAAAPADQTAAAASAAHTYSIFAGSTTRPEEGRLISRDETRTVAAVPAANAPCLITRFADGSQSMACGHTSDQQPASVSYSGAIGLVPDAVDSVTLTMADGSTRVVPVKNNVWTAPDEAATAAYALAGRVVEVELMPRSSMPAGATSEPSQAPSHRR